MNSTQISYGKKIPGLVKYFLLEIYKKLNRKYDKNTLPKLVRQETLDSILGEKITKLSVVITTRNRIAALKNHALKSLSTLEFDTLPYEIIVVDNNSSDSTYNFLNQESKNDPRIIPAQQTKIGASAGRNLGIKIAKGELILFMDDDCEVDQDWLSRTLKLHSEGKFLVGQGQIYDEETKELIIKEEGGQIDFLKTGNMATGNMSIRKKVFDFVSFNESIDLYHEDKDLIYQIKNFWPQFPYFIDNFAITHYREMSTYRNPNKSYSKKTIKNSIKNYNISCLSEYTLKRNFNIDRSLFSLKFIFKESFFTPLELICFVDGDFLSLFKTKIKLYKQLKYLIKNYLN